MRKHTSPQTKTRLIEALRRLLIENGLQGMDVRKICKEVDCSVGTFYNNYKSMDELIIHFNAETIDILNTSLFNSIAQNDEAKEVIHKICGNYIAFAKNNHAEWLLLMEHPLTIPLPSWYQDKVDTLFQKVSNIFHPILGGQQADIEKAVKVLWGALHGICSLTLKNKLRFAKEQDILKLCQEMFHYYILGYRIGYKII